MASSSSSTSANPNSTSNYSYDVFLNHRGPDVKKGFASRLYRRLVSYGLNVFLDQEELQRGENITSQIEGAIQTACVHVAIFSPGYAQSRWCLDELLMMLKSKATIIPVFYNVKPSDLQWTHGKDGVYARALRTLEKKTTYDPSTHQEKLRHDSATVEHWRNALSTVADISGFELEACNGDEGYLVDEVVKSVLKRVGVRERAYQVGLDEKVKDFENKVFLENHQSAKPQVVGIVGVRGVGKTTLAKKLFDRKRVDYSKFCFLSNVRENAKKGFLNSLQRQLLESLTGTDVLINSIHEGIEALKKHLSSDRVFVILDDVDQLNQIDALLPVRVDLLSDSLVLITSRDEKVIKSSGVENASIYQLTGLNDQHSLELFCAYAFSQPHPLSGFESRVDNFLEFCDGLPLFLKLFGALLLGKYGKSDWKDPLDKLRQVLLSDTQEKLQISYQSLEME